jgi:TolB protein
MDATSTSGAPTATGLTGTLVFQSSPGGTIYAYNLDTGATWSLTSGFDPEISPDGQTVVFVRDGGENGIYLIDIDGSNERLIFSGRTRLSSPKWSPDGQWILFTRSDGSYQCLEAGGSCIDLPSAPNGGGPEISDDDLVTRYWYNLARVDRDGNNYRDIGSLTSARAADWNEAGIVYQSDAGLQITADTPDSENKLVIFDYLKPFFEDPDWQPQGGRIVYMGKEASHTELFTVNPDGSGVTTLTRPTSTLVDEIPSNVAPAWSPDGQHIVFLSNRTAENEAGEWRLWVMDADGSNQRPLSINIPVTYSYGSDQTVSWGPTI